MTNNQINYWNLQETKRHNVVTEGIDQGKLNESVRHNTASESIEFGKLDESKRHNQASENISIASLFETQRHNTATEGEMYRHNTAVESVDAGKLSETKRHNIYQEKLDTIDKTQIQPVKSVMGSSLLVTQGIEEIGEYSEPTPEVALKVDAVKESISPLRIYGLVSGNPIASLTSAGLIIRDSISNYQKQKSALEGGKSHARKF